VLFNNSCARLESVAGLDAQLDKEDPGMDFRFG
jgi:hypothetical protein